jgi:hypothetical protein
MTAAIATAFSVAWPPIAAARSIGLANTPGPGHATKSGFEWADSNSFLQRAMLTRGGGIEGKLMADDEETATARYRQCLYAIDAESHRRDHQYDDERSRRLPLGTEEETARVSRRGAAGADARDTGSQGPRSYAREP